MPNFFQKILKGLFSDAHDDCTAEDTVFFGGFEECKGMNALPIAIYVPTQSGLVYLPYSAINDDVIEVLRAMAPGQAFKIICEESTGPLSGELVKIAPVERRLIVHIPGVNKAAADRQLCPPLQFGLQ